MRNKNQLCINGFLVFPILILVIISLGCGSFTWEEAPIGTKEKYSSSSSPQSKEALERASAGFITPTNPILGPPPEDPLLALLWEYSPRSYLILERTSSKYNLDFRMYLSGGDHLQDLLDISTSVHEFYHHYQFCYTSTVFSKLVKERPELTMCRTYILTPGKTFLIRYGDFKVFPTREIADLVPRDKRTTFRFPVYVLSEDNPNQSTQIHGIFGLLDELQAYYIDMSYSYEIFEYHKTLEQTSDLWISYIFNLTQSYGAYAEFTYWILTYLLYARENHPECYEAIMEKPALAWIIVYTRDRYAELIRKTDLRLLEVAETLKHLTGNNSHTYDKENGIYTVDGHLYINFSGIQEFHILVEAMEAPNYTEMLSLLKKKAEVFNSLALVRD